MASELIPISDFTPATVFVPGGLSEIVQRIRSEALSVVADPDTSEGRKVLIAEAAKVRRSKVWLDDRGKEYVAALKELPKQVDAERKWMRDTLEALADEIRRPVTDREEAEKARLAEIARIEREKAEAEAAAKEAELAELRRVKEEMEREAAAREREERIRRDAEESARLKAEAAAREALMAAERREREAREAQEAAERREAAEAAAAERREKEHAAALERAARLERERIEADAAAAKREADRLAADKAHRAACLHDALDDLIAAGTSPEIARAVLVLIAQGKVRRVRIDYSAG